MSQDRPSPPGMQAATAQDQPQLVTLREVPAYSRVSVHDWGSVDEVTDDISFTLEDVVTVWTRCEEPSNTFAAVEIRGVIDSTATLHWLPEDAQVHVVAPPRFAGHPEDLVRDVKPSPAPAGLKGALATPEGFHPLVWGHSPLESAVAGWDDPEIAVTVLLCALHVAPDDGNLRPQLLSALRARYARVKKDPRTYRPETLPWRDTLDPADFVDYLEG